MPAESLVKETVELQGFRVLTVTKADGGLEAELAPDGRYAPRALWLWTPHLQPWQPSVLLAVSSFAARGINAHLIYTQVQASCEHCGDAHVEVLPWASREAAIHACHDGEVGRPGTGSDPAAGDNPVR